MENSSAYLYELKSSLITKKEGEFFQCIKQSLPEGYIAVPQANLASFINRTDSARFQNELYRNVDFLITDANYKPLFIIEINDRSHYDYNRKQRDEKVRDICEEAGIPIIWLWTSYGVNHSYIQKRIQDTITNLSSPKRVHHFSLDPQNTQKQDAANGLSEASAPSGNPADAVKKTGKGGFGSRSITWGYVLSLLSGFLCGFPLFLRFVRNDNSLLTSIKGGTNYFCLFLAFASLAIGVLAAREMRTRKSGIVIMGISVLSIVFGLIVLFL